MKQENCCTPEGQIKRYKDCIGCDKKPKHETLEETIKNNIIEDWLEEHGNPEICKRVKCKLEQITLEEAFRKWSNNTKLFDKGELNAFKAGVKCQAERMYSEEEVVYFIHKFLKEHQPHLPYVTGGINMWFEQFKKK
jgi:hypothetical protein